MSLRYYYASAASCASFLALYKYFNPSLTIKFIPEFKNLSNPKRVEWSSRTNSSVHAVLVSMLCLYCLIYEDDISLDPIWGESDLVRMTCAIVVGYMCSDVLIVLFHYSEIGEIFFLFHHAASIYAFCFAMTYGALLWFANVRLIAEFSTPFVNKRWFLDVLGYKKYSPPVVLNGVSMTVMFFFVRVVSVPFYWLKVYSIYGSEKCDSLGKIWYVLISSCLILDIINLYWFLKITQGIIKVLRTTNQNSDITQYCHNIFGKSDPYTYKMSGNSFHNDSVYYREGSLKHRPSKFNSQLDGYHDSVSPIARLSS